MLPVLCVCVCVCVCVVSCRVVSLAVSLRRAWPAKSQAEKLRSSGSFPLLLVCTLTVHSVMLMPSVAMVVGAFLRLMWGIFLEIEGECVVTFLRHLTSDVFPTLPSPGDAYAPRHPHSFSHSFTIR